MGDIIERLPLYNLIGENVTDVKKALTRIEKSLLKCNLSFISEEETEKIKHITKFIGEGKLNHYEDVKGGDINFYGTIKSTMIFIYFFFTFYIITNIFK